MHGTGAILPRGSVRVDEVVQGVLARLEKLLDPGQTAGHDKTVNV